jgi:hypothetical protein
MNRVNQALNTGFEWTSIIEWDRPEPEVGCHTVHVTWPRLILLGFQQDPHEVRDFYCVSFKVHRFDGSMTVKLEVDVDEHEEPGVVWVRKIRNVSFFYNEDN